MDYLDVDPFPDIRNCVSEIRSFCIKDHRNWPKDQDCGPGFGEIDHYRLFEPVAFSGLTIPLAYENISAPLVKPPTSADEIDGLARRARTYLETVIQGIQQIQKDYAGEHDPCQRFKLVQVSTTQPMESQRLSRWFVRFFATHALGGGHAP